MRGGNFLALGLIALAVVLMWLAVSGNYRATWQALLRKYQGGSSHAAAGA